MVETTKELIERLNVATAKVEKYNDKIDKVTARIIGANIADYILKVTPIIKELGNRTETIEAVVAVNKFRVAVHKTNILVGKFIK